MRTIDADALIALVQDSTILGDGFKQAFCALVNGEPTIEPERKKGKWNWISFNIECSECGFMPNFDSTEPLYNFCPNCGAKMEGETDETA